MSEHYSVCNLLEFEPNSDSVTIKSSVLDSMVSLALVFGTFIWYEIINVWV